MPKDPITLAPFADADFVVYGASYQRNEDWNGKRLEIRRKLESYGKAAAEVIGAAGLALDVRTSLHHPFEFNGFRVTQQWVYLTRNKKEKTALKKILGPELGKDLDSSYRNLYLALSIDETGLEISFKIHPDAWFDGQNLKNKCQDDARLREWVAILNRLPGFEFRIHDWKKVYEASRVTRTDLLDFYKYYVPGEHRLPLSLRVGREDPVATSGEFADLALESFRALAPAYAFAAWSPANDFLNLRG